MWYSCAVLVGTMVPEDLLGTPVEFGGGLRLEKLPEWVKADAAVATLSWREQYAIRDDANAVLCMEYGGGDALGGPDPEGRGGKPRPIQEGVAERVALAEMSLWLEEPCGWSAGPILHFQEKGNPASLRQAGVMQKVSVFPEDLARIPTAASLRIAAERHKVMWDLRRELQGSGAIWIALRMLQTGITETLWEVRYMLLWVVLEALFGPVDGREITFRLSQRIGLFLGGGGAIGRDLFGKAREGYRFRSKAVHGGRLAGLTPDKSLSLMRDTEGLIRDAFRKILADRKLIEAFDGDRREAFLDALVFGGQT